MGAVGNKIFAAPVGGGCARRAAAPTRGSLLPSPAMGLLWRVPVAGDRHGYLAARFGGMGSQPVTREPQTSLFSVTFARRRKPGGAGPGSQKCVAASLPAGDLGGDLHRVGSCARRFWGGRLERHLAGALVEGACV